MATTLNRTRGSGADARGEALERARPRRWPRRLLKTLLGVAVLGLLVAVAIGVPAASARAELLTARTELRRAQAALTDGRAGQAAVHLAAATERFNAAGAYLDSPGVALLANVPALGNTAQALRGLARSGELMSQAGSSLAQAVDALPGGAMALAPRDGVLALEPLTALQPVMAEAADLAVEARDIAVATPSTMLLPEVASARAEFLEQAEHLAPGLVTAEALTRALPGFFGADGPKRYFFGVATPTEVRGASGFIGAYAVLRADGGRLDFEPFQRIGMLPYFEPGEVPAPNPDYAARYDYFGGASSWQNINFTPDFPSAARAMEELYERGTGERVDGVIVADPHALGALLEIAGPVDVPDIGRMDAESIVEFAGNTAYRVITDKEDRHELIGDVASAALRRFLDGGRADPAVVVGALGGAARGGHLLLHSTDDDVQEGLRAAGVTGDLEAPVAGDFLAVVGNNNAQNKIDYFAERTVRYEVWLEPDGTATAFASVELANLAPLVGQPAYVLGPNVDYLQRGDNLTYLSVYCAPGCERRRSLRGDQPYATVWDEEELGIPVQSTYELVPAGETRSITHTLHLPAAWTVDGASGRYALTVRDQPTIRPTRTEIVVHPPEGWQIAEVSGGGRRTADAVTWERSSGLLQEFRVELQRPLPARVVHAVGTHLERVRNYWRGVFG